MVRDFKEVPGFGFFFDSPYPSFRSPLDLYSDYFVTRRPLGTQKQKRDTSYQQSFFQDPLFDRKSWTVNFNLHRSGWSENNFLDYYVKVKVKIKKEDLVTVKKL